MCFSGSKNCFTLNALVAGVGPVDAALTLSVVALDSIKNFVISIAKKNPEAVTPEILSGLFGMIDVMIKAYKIDNPSREIRSAGVAAAISISHSGWAHTASLGTCCAIARWTTEQGISYKRLCPKADIAVERIPENLSSTIPYTAPLGFLGLGNFGALIPHAQEIGETGCKIAPEVTPLKSAGDYVALLSYELSPKEEDVTRTIAPIITEGDFRRIAEHFVRVHPLRFEDCMVSVLARLKAPAT